MDGDGTTKRAAAPLPLEALELWAERDGERGLVFLDAEHRVAGWTGAAEQITGHPREAVVGRPWAEVVKGMTLAVEITTEPLRRDGRLVGFALVLRSNDLTDRKRTEQRLRDSEERFEFALRGANDGIWDWNLLTDDVVFSSRWKSMLGYSDDELPNNVTTWRSLVHPDDLPPAEERVRQYLSGEIDRYEVEFRMAHKAGGHRNILARGYLVSDEQSRPIRFVGTHVDITERKQAELKLRQSEEALRRAQAIAHVTSWSFDIASGTLATSDEGERLMERPHDYTMRSSARPLPRHRRLARSGGGRDFVRARAPSGDQRRREMGERPRHDGP
jgi:PAS domain S-box-containing protein